MSKPILSVFAGAVSFVLAAYVLAGDAPAGGAPAMQHATDAAKAMPTDEALISSAMKAAPRKVATYSVAGLL